MGLYLQGAYHLLGELVRERESKSVSPQELIKPFPRESPARPASSACREALRWLFFRAQGWASRASKSHFSAASWSAASGDFYTHQFSVPTHHLWVGPARCVLTSLPGTRTLEFENHLIQWAWCGMWRSGLLNVSRAAETPCVLGRGRLSAAVPVWGCRGPGTGRSPQPRTALK